MTEIAWRELRRQVEAELAGAAIANSGGEARWICEHVSGHAGVEWAEIERAAPTARQRDRLTSLVARRIGGEPLQYVLGEWPFRDLDLLVDARVLIPRPETEWVVEVALRHAPVRTRLAVDLGTGSGAIALSLARARPEWRVVATDASAEALAVARWNGAGNSVRTVEFALGGWYDALDSRHRGEIDLIVSNPPYVAVGEAADLAPEVRDHEPHAALFAGADGLDAIRVIVAGAPRWLAPGGLLVVEHAPAQADAVIALATAAGLTDARTEPDLTGRPRMLLARRP